MRGILFCSNNHCRARLLSGPVVVTFCTHVFCCSCSSVMEDSMQCLACMSDLRGDWRMHRTNLQPEDRFRSMVLAGLSPPVIMDIASRAVRFHQHLLTQEVNYLSARVERLVSKVEAVKQFYEVVIERLKVELAEVEGRLELSRQQQKVGMSRLVGVRVVEESRVSLGGEEMVFLQRHSSMDRGCITSSTELRPDSVWGAVRTTSSLASLGVGVWGSASSLGRRDF